jgi:hypothetical protein
MTDPLRIAITSPADRRVHTFGDVVPVVVYAQFDTSVDLYVDGVLDGTMVSGAGGEFRRNWTVPAVADSSILLTAVGNVTGTSDAIIATASQTNPVAINVTASWTKTRCSSTAGHPDPLGGNNAHRVTCGALTGLLVRIAATSSVVPTDTNYGAEVWIKPIGDCNIVNFDVGAGYGFLDLNTLQIRNSGAVAYIAERKSDGWVRLQVQRVGTLGGVPANLSMDFLSGTVASGRNATVSSAQAASGFGAFIFMPRFVPDTVFPLDPSRRLTLEYVSTSGSVETWGYRCDYASAASDLVSGGGNRTLQVYKPTGWSQTGNHKVLWGLPALTEAQEVGAGNNTMQAAFDYQDYANLYNTVVILVRGKNGDEQYWNRRSADGTSDYQSVLEGLWRQSINCLGAKADRHYHMYIGYSKSGETGASFVMRKPEMAGYGAGWDAFLNIWDYFGSGSMTAYWTDRTNYMNYNAKNIASTYKASVKDKKRLVVMGYRVFQTDVDAFKTELDTQKIPYYYRSNSESVHSWGSSTWVPIAIKELHRMRNFVPQAMCM